MGSVPHGCRRAYPYSNPTTTAITRHTNMIAPGSHSLTGALSLTGGFAGFGVGQFALLAESSSGMNVRCSLPSVVMLQA